MFHSNSAAKFEQTRAHSRRANIVFMQNAARMFVSVEPFISDMPALGMRRSPRELRNVCAMQ